MVTKRVANSMLVLRIVALATAAATIALLFNDKYNLRNGAEVKYKEFNAYRLVVAIAAMACLYNIVQLPFAIYYAIRQKRLINNEIFPEFDFYGDKITSLVLGIGIGAGFAVSVELKKFIHDHIIVRANHKEDDEDFKSTYTKILVRGFVASAFLLVTFLSMTLLSFISSNNRRQRN